MWVKTKIKEYPDGTKKVYVFEQEVLKTDGLEQSSAVSSGGSIMDSDDAEYIKARNLSKTKAKIADYVRSNDFELFLTLTFKDDRNNDERCFSRLSEWLKYMRRKHGKFDYILIPERHADGCLHFHGVFANFGGVVKDSGVKHKKQPIYNITEWRYGFSTATKIRDKKRVSNYITKYVVKDLDQNIVGKGKKKYWSSRGLAVPVESYYSDIPFSLKNEVWSNSNVKIYEL